MTPFEEQKPIAFTRTLETPSGEISPGRTFNLRYRIESELGRGGMGIVYKAEDIKLQRAVALKFLPPELLGNREAKQRFLREAQAAAALSHSNICTIHEVDEAEGKTYISMAYVEGDSLHDRIKEGPLDVKTGLTMSIQAAEGLAAAHKKGIVHRDIKSANIMVDNHGQAKIMDFGLAKTADSTMITREGVTMGTVAYMSPEQALGKTVDHRTDIWSLGVVLFEMFGCRLPFGGENQASFLYSIVHEEPKPLKALNPDIPVEVQKVISRALKKKPEDRYSSAADMAAELRKFEGRLRAEESGLFSLRTLWRRIRRPQIAIPATLFLIALAAFTFLQLDRRAKIRWAREVALSEIKGYMDRNEKTSAFELGQEAKKHIPKNGELRDILDEISSPFSVTTIPPGADVYMKDYGREDQQWTHLGETPLEETLIPGGFKQLRIEKPGYERFNGAVYIFTNDWVTNEKSAWSVEFTFDKKGKYPEGMVHINAARFSITDRPSLDSKPYCPIVSRLRPLKKIPIGEYLLDRHEVTNKEYKKFLDSGGYTNKKFWKHDFVSEGKILSWDEAMRIFVDKTGRPGPGTWELGDYPEGQEEYPVSGVSWYEAAAFAQFAEKRLPTVYHWNFATGIADSYLRNPSESPFVIPHCNLGGSGPWPVSESGAIFSQGIYDLAGNVKEWCLNAEGDKRILMGGSWNEPQYLAFIAESYPPLLRLHNFGFRCMMDLSGGETFRMASQPLEAAPPFEFSRYKTCSDGEFRILKSLYAYPPTELDAETLSTEDWSTGVVMEKVSFNAAYGGERMIAYIFRPQENTPPLQIMIYFSGGYPGRLKSIHEYHVKGQVDWLVKSNRAVVFPIYNGWFERSLPPPEEGNYFDWRDRTIMEFQDLSRTIDYLETKPDIFDTDKIGFYGISTGGFYAAIAPAIEERISATVILSAGLIPDFDFSNPFNFCPRVKVPVLMIFGRYDTGIPFETRIKPLYELLGTPDEDKHLKLYETGHGIWFDYKWKKDILDFLDRYFGPAR